MKEFKVNLEEENKNLTNLDGVEVAEIHIVLQVWQDLRKTNSSYVEDRVMESILEQILRQEHGDAIPKGYEPEKGVMEFSPNKDGALSTMEKIEFPEEPSE